MVNAYYREMEATYHYHHIGREFNVNESKRGLDVRQTVRLCDINTLRVGGQVSKWVNPTGKLDYGGWFQRPNKTYFLRSIPQDQTDYGGYVQDELIVLPDKLTLDGGVRWDRTYVAKGYAVRNGATASRTGFWQDPALSYSFGARYELTQRQTLTARCAYSKEAVSGGYVSATGTPLQDCAETRYELGYECRFHKAFVVTLTAFWKDIDNGLVYDGQAPVAGEWVTAWRSADFDRYGYELQARGEITAGLTYFSSCTYVHSVDRDTHDPDDRIPSYLLSGGLRYQTGPWKAAMAVLHTARYQDDFNTAPTRFADVGDFTLVDVNLGRTFTAAGIEHELYGGVRNLLNQRYETIPGYRDPGLAVYAGYAVRF
jgi:outer membrane receptor protein involved in Fe transport